MLPMELQYPLNKTETNRVFQVEIAITLSLNEH